MEFVLESDSSKKTQEYGKEFSKLFKGGEILLLDGPLGGGKTTFVKGVMAGLGYSGRVLSPSFTISRLYKAEKYDVCHVDLYRLEAGDIFDTGIGADFYDKNVIYIIEWGQKLKEELSEYIEVKFEFLGEENRRLTFSMSDFCLKKFSRLIKKVLVSRHKTRSKK
ncbi:MAG: tRNA (adenosine(37)-N6)-threonylcarbamoyltransferase complex ATPase subunit type 1 TsaE [Candidatus Omnitrophica bacterium]|nr:tRNA (adenosine(37)-N6)-threonylcarbamoyltransferase complex ATPase subunit type 1 TsaE [Candidatus Omnitrophota bacterium]MDD5429585.1 tRNA (adenosine(37)-N6)-threonylcarbamoyltransferase complex ATPase subunit type 1 TsaE [Candidatus Omnitrophota bacterium]